MTYQQLANACKDIYTDIEILGVLSGTCERSKEVKKRLNDKINKLEKMLEESKI